MQNELSIQLFFFAMAVTVALEAYKERDRRIARIILWMIASAFGFAGFLWPSISHSWPGFTSELGSLVGDPSTWFIIFVAIYFILRPFWQRELPRSDMEAIEAGAGAGGAGVVALRKQLDDLATKLENVRADGAHTSRKADQLSAKIDADAEKRQGSIYAIWMRERSAKLEEFIQQCADKLYADLAAGHVLDANQWEAWEKVHADWEYALNEWTEISKWYAPRVSASVQEVKEADFAGKWAVAESQFPSSDAIRRFKRHRIIQSNWNRMRPSVQSGMTNVAFMGMTDREARDGQPAG